MRTRRPAALLFAIAAVASAAALARPYTRGLSFAIRAADIQGMPRRLADFGTTSTQEREIEIPTARGPLRARLYEPARPRHRAALLVPGPHPAGIDEPRVVGLARHLSGSGLTIVTPDIPELLRFEIAPVVTNAIQQAGLWLSSDADLAPDGKVGLIGISFSGGLAAVAAGRPSMAQRVAFVLSLGGHADLPRVLRYLCTGVEPRPQQQIRLGENVGAFVRPNDDGVAMVLLGLAPRLVPPAQVEPLRAAVRTFLSASHLNGGDQPQAARDVDSLREAAKRLPAPSATLLRYVTQHDVVHLGTRLLPYVDSYGRDPALSPSRSAKPSAPVFLLHGVDDNLIPAVESEYLAEELRGHVPIRVVLSGPVLQSGADRRTRTSDALRYAGFWGDLLSR